MGGLSLKQVAHDEKSTTICAHTFQKGRSERAVCDVFPLEPLSNRKDCPASRADASRHLASSGVNSVTVLDSSAVSILEASCTVQSWCHFPAELFAHCNNCGCYCTRPEPPWTFLASRTCFTGFLPFCSELLLPSKIFQISVCRLHHTASIPPNLP